MQIYLKKSIVDYYKTVIAKSLKDDRFNYFKKKVLDHLSKLESKEKDIKKAISFAESLVKSGYPVGTIRIWKGKKYIKVAPNKWRPKYDSNTRGAKLSIAAIKRKVEKCTDSEQLLQIVLENRDRFSDENGHLLPFVKDLHDYVSKINDNIEKRKNKIFKKSITMDSLPLPLTKGKWKSQFKNFVDYINIQQDADPEVVNMYAAMSKIPITVPLKVGKVTKQNPTGGLKVYYYALTKEPVEQKLLLSDKMTDEHEKRVAIATAVHELMHYMDFNLRTDRNSIKYLSKTDVGLSNAIENAKISEETMSFINDRATKTLNSMSEYSRQIQDICDDTDKLNEAYKTGKMVYSDYSEQYDKLIKKAKEIRGQSSDLRGNVQGFSALCDIYDAITGGEISSKFGCFGHGAKYWQDDDDNKSAEIMAEVALISIMDKNIFDYLKRDQPQLVNAVFNVYNKMTKALEEL